MKNLLMVVFWFAIAAIFAGWLHFTYGADLANQFVSGYLIEKSLSVDNLFVFSLIFRAYGIPSSQQSYYLNWGIIGAFVLRAVFILIGAGLLALWHPILYFAGAFLIYTSVKLVLSNKEPQISPKIKKLTEKMPFALAVITTIELSDILFAIDSVPAVFGVTQNPLIVYSSNMLAIMGLRSLYFVLVDLLDRFHLLEKGVSLVLFLIGLKILISGWYEIPTAISLAATAGIIFTSIVASLIVKKEEEEVA